MTWKKVEAQAGVLTALFAGLAAGIAITLLASWKSDALKASLEEAKNRGDALRHDALDLAQRGIKQVKDATGTAAEKVNAAASSALEKGEKGAHDAIDKTVGAVKSVAREGHRALDEASQAVRTRVAG